MDYIQEFIEELGGVNNCIGRERKELYDLYIQFCMRRGLYIVTSQAFTRRFNVLCDTKLKLVTRDCKVTYIIVRRES